MGQQISTNHAVHGYIHDRQYSGAPPVVDINSFADFSFYPDKYSGQSGRKFGQPLSRPVPRDFNNQSWSDRAGWTAQSNSLDVPTTHWDGMADSMAGKFESHSLPTSTITKTDIGATRDRHYSATSSSSDRHSSLSGRHSSSSDRQYSPPSSSERPPPSPDHQPCKPVQRQFSDFSFYPDRFDYAPRTSGRC